MRPEGGKTVGGAGSSGVEEADVVKSVIAAESAPCEVLVWEVACWATTVAAAWASAEPVPPSEMFIWIVTEITVSCSRGLLKYSQAF